MTNQNKFLVQNYNKSWIFKPGRSRKTLNKPIPRENFSDNVQELLFNKNLFRGWINIMQPKNEKISK